MTTVRALTSVTGMLANQLAMDAGANNVATLIHQDLKVAEQPSVRT